MINKGPVYLQAMKNRSGLTWYERQPTGKDSINAIMKKMKQNSPLQELCPDKKQTNHSGRKTVVRKCKRMRFLSVKLSTSLVIDMNVDQTHMILETRRNKDFGGMLLTKSLSHM